MMSSTLFSGFKIIISVLPLFLGGCGTGQTASGNNLPNVNKSNVQNQQVKSPSSTMNIQKGAVGKIGNYSIGLRSINSSVADVAVWNPGLPQVNRNDYVIGFTFKKGDVIPIGNNFYKVSDITPDTVQIDTEAVKTENITLHDGDSVIPEKGSLELNGYVVEVNSVDQNDGRTSADIEIYNSDVPKTELEAGKINKVVAVAGSEVKIGGKAYKVVAVYTRQENFPGILEISNAPSN